MSRIGQKAIPLTDSVSATISASEVSIKGPKGELTVSLLPNIEVEIKDNLIFVTRKNDEIATKAYHGLIRSLINNHVLGVKEGYKKTLKLIGTGYRVTAQGQNLSMTLGFSHPVVVKPLEGTTFKVEGNDTIHIEGIDKQRVGQMAADIRAIKPPEPYKGKGIRYEDEVVIRKQGKTTA